MLIDLLPALNPYGVIAGVIAWDVATIWVIWRLSARPAKRHRFKAPPGVKRSRHWGDPGNTVSRVHRDGDLW